MQPTIFQLELVGDKYILNYDGGSCTWDDPKEVKDFFKMWMKEHKLNK
jgi:hypothetical protein